MAFILLSSLPGDLVWVGGIAPPTVFLNEVPTSAVGESRHAAFVSAGGGERGLSTPPFPAI